MKRLILTVSFALATLPMISHAGEFDYRARKAEAQRKAQLKSGNEVNRVIAVQQAKAAIQQLGRCHDGIRKVNNSDAFNVGIYNQFMVYANFETGDDLACSSYPASVICENGRCKGPYFIVQCYDGSNQPVKIDCP